MSQGSGHPGVRKVFHDPAVASLQQSLSIFHSSTLTYISTESIFTFLLRWILFSFVSPFPCTQPFTFPDLNTATLSICTYCIAPSLVLFVIVHCGHFFKSNSFSHSDRGKRLQIWRKPSHRLGNEALRIWC